MPTPRVSFDDLPAVTALLDEARGGNRAATEALADLVFEHIEQLVRRVRQRFPGIQQLESTTADANEVFLRVMLKPQGEKKIKFESRSHFLGSCFTTAHRMLIDRLRAWQRQQARLQAVAETPRSSAADPAQLIEVDEDIAMVRLVLKELPPDDYSIVCLIYFLGMSQSKAFHLLDLPESTGRDRLKRIMVRLGAALRPLQ